MSVKPVTFIFNPNSQPPSAQVNVNFNDVTNRINLIGGGEFSPAQITGDQNNFSTLNLDSEIISVLRLDTDASRTITGFDDGEEGRFLYILNVGTNNLVLANQSGSSDAENRIITSTGASITIAADNAAILYYDSTTTRWRVLVT